MKAKVKILILAAGKGVRMQSEHPKALAKVGGKSMIARLLSAVKNSDIDPRPAIVVGYGKDAVMAELGDGYDFIVQDTQLGTGHAVLSAQEFLKNKAENILVLPSDHPFISANTIKKLAESHLRSGAKITMATVRLADFDDWRAFFYTNFSRIIRNTNGEIIRDVQFKDATEEEKKHTEINPIYFCFEAAWLWKNIGKLGRENAQNEYYLTDLIKLAMESGEKINSAEIDPLEALSANSREELEVLEKFVIK